MALVFEINGVAWEVDRGRIQKPQNAPWRLTAVAWADAPGDAPELDDEVELIRDGVTIFAGSITSVRISGIAGHGTPQVSADINALDWNTLPARRSVTSLTIPAGTLKQALQAIVPYLDGVTLDAGQVDGPSLPELTYSAWSVQQVLEQLTTLTDSQYVWRISFAKVLKMFALGSEAAPFDINESNVGDYVDGDLVVEPQRNDYANRVIVIGGGVTATAEDAAEIALRGTWDRVYQSPDSTTQAAVDALAAAALARDLAILKTVEYPTLAWGLNPGQTQTIDLPTLRGIDNTYVLQDVEHVFDGELIRTTVKALEGSAYKPGWLQKLEGGGSGGGVTLPGLGGGGILFERYPLTLNASWETGVRSATPTWVAAGALEVELNTVARGSTQATVTLMLRAFSAGISVQARIYDLSAPGALAELSTVVTSTSWQRVTWTVTLNPGAHFYRLELLPGAADEDVYGVGYIR